METTQALTVSQLTKKVGKKTIVSDVSFSLTPGKITGLLGPNGAGKTTIIRLLVGLMSPTNGTIEIVGYNLQENFSNALRQVGAIIETPEFYNYLTGTENLRLLAKMSDATISEEKIQQALSAVHLTQQKDQKVRTYSLGMRQRLGVAQAMVHSPKVLVFDEPMNGLDPAGMREFRELLFELAQSGVAILISSHQLAEIELMCDTLIILQNGVVTRTENLQKEKTVTSLGRLRLETTDNLQAIALLSQAGFHVEQKENEIFIHVETDEREKISRLLMAQQIAILTFVFDRPTLEDNFLNWTKGGELK
ncbi:ABC transporter ATP-binding protein [Enterococcus timonensis]|uniref:ABC transporter ATP-binding protein n=1 Tax=Enterococcus timonensis TaxID=1852364 RepID=UPI0008DABE2B|nr:ABC transporter ATP-binding protein [Enterococcus timonensis]